MLQIISICKVTDFAPLFFFVTVTTAEQRLLEYSIYVKWLEWVSVHLSDTEITINNLTNQSLPVQIQHGHSRLRNSLYHFPLLA